MSEQETVAKLLFIRQEVDRMQAENTSLQQQVADLQEKVDKSTELISKYGYIGGSHHKQWLLDQIAQILIDDYELWAGSDWDKGIAP